MSNIITDMFDGMPVSVLMGANLAGEVAKGAFCETTVGCSKLETSGKVYKKLFQTPNFRVSVVNDVKTVEICGALKVSNANERIGINQRWYIRVTTSRTLSPVVRDSSTA